MTVKTANNVLGEVLAERVTQDAKWGEQNHPDGTGSASDALIRDQLRKQCDHAAELGECTWKKILHEEVYEAFAEKDPQRLREELIQVAAVAVAWVEAIDRRANQ